MKTNQNTNSVTGADLKDGDHVMVSELAYPHSISRVFRCSGGGFGSKAGASGTAVMGHWVDDGNCERIERYEIMRFADRDDIGFATWVNTFVSKKLQSQYVEASRLAQQCSTLRAAAKKPNKHTKRDIIQLAFEMEAHMDWAMRWLAGLQEGEFTIENLPFNPKWMSAHFDSKHLCEMREEWYGSYIDNWQDCTPEEIKEWKEDA